MNKYFFSLLLLVSATAFAQPRTATGIVLDAAWKVKLNDFALKNVVHQSWGYPHAERNFQNTLKLAKLENIAVDEDVLFAAALLHDLGGLTGFEKEGVDHAVRSAEIAGPLLQSFGFPENKIDDVKEIILGHVYYGPKPQGTVVQLFRDADILDFMGTMGVARLLAANVELGKKPAIENSTLTMKQMMTKLPAELMSPSAQKEGKSRMREMQNFLQMLEKYSFGGKAL